jgi:hypothetical protein
VDKNLISCEQKNIWPVINGLKKMLKWPTATVYAKLSLVAPRIPGTMKDVRHVVYRHLSCFNGSPQLIPYVTLLCTNITLQMAPQV